MSRSSVAAPDRSSAPTGVPMAPGSPPQVLPRLQWVFWLALAVAVCLGFALRASRPALVNPLVVHDDVRQHAFWVPRLHDPTLFPNDWIADYYQAQAPAGYRAVYWLLTSVVDTVSATKFLPLGLSVVLAATGFALGRALWGRSDAAALGSILLAWSAWQYDDLASATPRAFALPLLTLQLAALASGRWRLALVVLPVQALLYPLGCALGVVTIGAWIVWEATADLPTRLPVRRLLWLGAATALALVLVGLGRLDAARYGNTVSATEAREMEEFQRGGRAAYFVPDWYEFWIESHRSGLALKPKDTVFEELPALTIPFVLAAMLGVWVLAARLGRAPAAGVPRAGVLLPIVLVSSLGLFFAAHALLFWLYLPARHVQFSLPLVWALAGGFCWARLGDRLPARLASPIGAWAGLSGAEVVTLAGIVLLVLHAPPPGDFYVAGRQPAIYGYLRQTPPDTLVGALPADSNIVPLFGQRAVLTTYEHALPYHPGYYRPLRERIEAFRAAYYAPTLAPLVSVLDEFGVDLVIADREALERRRHAQRERPPALEELLDRCGVLRERDLVIVPASCIRTEAARRSS